MLQRRACVRAAAGANTNHSTSAQLSDPFASPGWPDARSHRTRRPAQQVAPGVGSSSGSPPSSRKQRRQATTARELLRRSSSAASNSAARPAPPRPQHTWREFYAQREAAAAAAAGGGGDGAAEAVTGRQQAARRLLFSAPAGDAAAAAGTRALRGKLVPALRTTQQWTRVQRKLLPRYLYVLDAVTAPLLLKTLVRLQPPRPGVPDSSEEALPGGATPGSLAANKQQEQQLLPVSGVSSSLLLQLTTSNSGSLRVRGAAAMQAQQTTTLGTATPRGFADAASEQREFEGMLLVVYDALRHKLAAWPGDVLTQLLGASGQLLVVHHAFVQALLAASGGQLVQQPMPQLVGCLEALARLQVLPSDAWRAQWVVATQDRLDQLSLPQLAALQLHTASLQLPLPGAWWQQFGAAVLQHAAQATTAINSRQLVSVADALSSLLCAAAIAPPPAPPPTQQQPDAGSSSWHAPCLQVCLMACQRGRLSTSGVVQLLAACSLPGGSCTRLPGAPAARSAALQLLCQRMSKLPCPAGVELLFASLQALGATHDADPLPPDLRAALEARLVEVLPQLPAHVLLQVPSALGAAGGAAAGGAEPAGDRLLAAFALVSQAQLERLSAAQLVALLRACAAAGFDMPTVWCRAAGQRLAAAAEEEELASDEAWQQQQQLAACLIAGSGWMQQHLVVVRAERGR